MVLSFFAYMLEGITAYKSRVLYVSLQGCKTRMFGAKVIGAIKNTSQESFATQTP